MGTESRVVYVSEEGNVFCSWGPSFPYLSAGSFLCIYNSNLKTLAARKRDGLAWWKELFGSRRIKYSFCVGYPRGVSEQDDTLP
jgi:hypothetical protein